MGLVFVGLAASLTLIHKNSCHNGPDQIFDEIVNLISSLFENQVNLVVGVYFKFYSVINTPQLTSLTQQRYIEVC